VCVCNVHVVVTADRDDALRDAVNGADLAIPDGAPVAWAMRRLGHPAQRRVAGPDLAWNLYQVAADSALPVYFFGSTEHTLARLTERLRTEFPALKVAGAQSPPFRPLTAQENAEAVEAINRSGARIVFVGLGCPKQELWMAAQKDRIHGVMLGVGAAFDFHAGTVNRAPLWMQRSGLEWLHRLASEPSRLWRRYLATNTRYIAGVARQLAGRSAARPPGATRRRS
jgi:N-acetylglucosaminyldiphosphoundecaprenol N-acetyl-beta-D-mannosaminyltransferase